MPIPTFTPSIGPSPGTKFAPKPTVLSAPFGEGYSQDSPSGVSSLSNEVNLAWNGLTEAQAVELWDFFHERGGNEPFYYTPRSFAEQTVWVCAEWERKDGAPWSFTAKLTQYHGAI